MGLARPAVRLYELVLAARSHASAKRLQEEGGLPLPPARLRAQAGPRHADAEYFLRSGEHHAQLVRDLLQENGTSVEELEALLDWGCGCGRILRHWAGLPNTRVMGCDVNPKMVAWCNANLDFAEVARTEMSPPLPYADSIVRSRLRVLGVHALARRTSARLDAREQARAEARRLPAHVDPR